MGFALFVFWLLLIARVVVEFIRSFSRDWHPRADGGDPRGDHDGHRSAGEAAAPLIPQLTIGAIRFDLSIMVLLLLAFIGMQPAFSAAA